MSKRRKRTNKNVPAKGRLRDMCDRLWSLAVKRDWNNCCAVCQSTTCESHHLIPRQHNATRYEIWNGICLCARHHQFCPDVSPHQNAAGFLRWLEHNHQLHYRWYKESDESGKYKKFKGITNPQYYCDVILELKQYVDDEDYVRIVGKKFSQYLDEQE